jgi:hypothetical protein
MALNTLKVYERANKINAVIVMYLLSNTESQEVGNARNSIKWQSQIGENTEEQILPMQNLTLLSTRQVEMLEALTTVTVGRHQGIPMDPLIISPFCP